MKKLLDKTIYRWVNFFCNNRHNLLFVYCIVLLFLLLGVMSDSGSSYVSYLLVYSGVFLLSYFLLDYLPDRAKPIPRKILTVISKLELMNTHKIFLGILLGVIGFILFHFVLLGGIPTIKALGSNDSFEIYSIRHSVTADSPSIINYLSSFILKGVIPFLLLYSFHKYGWKLFSVVFAVSLIYCISLVAKSYVVTSFIPLMIYALYMKHFFRFILFALIIFCGLNFLMFVANPSLRSGDANKRIVTEHVESKEQGLENSVSNLMHRTYYIPGKIVSGWFKAIPSQKPFLYGCGYRFIAPIKNCNYHEYSTELYPILYPEYSKLGYAGTVNVASFMYDYANFGWLGIIYSAIFLALIFLFVNSIFKGNNSIKLFMSIFYVLMLSSSSYLTLFFSGGWGLMIFLFLIFRKDFQSNYSNQNLGEVQ
ncbi:MAG TPA: hypothetical protein DCQ93_02525 [Bacteroidetes bacterium]|nr:hypothetical protein [Bacteroidota bacterium]